MALFTGTWKPLSQWHGSPSHKAESLHFPKEISRKIFSLILNYFVRKQQSPTIKKCHDEIKISSQSTLYVRLHTENGMQGYTPRRHEEMGKED